VAGKTRKLGFVSSPTSRFYLTATVKAFASTLGRGAAAPDSLPLVVAAGWRILEGIAPQ